MILTVPLYLAIAALIDYWRGEPRRFHPLVGYGHYVKWIESICYDDNRQRGVMALVLALLPVIGFVALAELAADTWLYPIAAVLVIYLATGLRSLIEHAEQIARPLVQGDITQARHYLGYIVSRDTSELDEQAVSKATIESVLENGNDAAFAAWFWFAVAGIPGIALYRMANTLDAMWGYRNDRYQWFGWAAARLDDLLNWVPARLTAFCYALAGRFAPAWRCWRLQGHQWKSPNAGPVMAAGAGSLGVELGGDAPYHGQWQSRLVLGCGEEPVSSDISRACQLVLRAAAWWILLIVIVSLVFG